MTLPRADWADCLLRITLDAKHTPKLWEGSCGVADQEAVDVSRKDW